jgi:hypothetical protein
VLIEKLDFYHTIVSGGAFKEIRTKLSSLSREKVNECLKKKKKKADCSKCSAQKSLSHAFGSALLPSYICIYHASEEQNKAQVSQLKHSVKWRMNVARIYSSTSLELWPGELRRIHTQTDRGERRNLMYIFPCHSYYVSPAPAPPPPPLLVRMKRNTYIFIRSFMLEHHFLG